MSGTVNIETGRLIVKRRDGQVDAATVQTSSFTASTAGGSIGSPADILTSLLTVDGAGSGLDADLLDGQHGSFYAPIDSPSFTGTLNHTGAQASLANGAVVIGGGNEIWTQPSVNAAATLYINHRGYGGGTTQFRNTDIRDGKNVSIAYFDGSTKWVGIGISPTSKLDVLGDVSIAGVGNHLYFDTLGSRQTASLYVDNDYWLNILCNRGTTSKIILKNDPSILFETGGTGRLTISNTGLNVTGSITTSGDIIVNGNELYLNGTNYLSGDTAGRLRVNGVFAVSGNEIYLGSGGEYISSDTASTLRVPNDFKIGRHLIVTNDMSSPSFTQGFAGNGWKNDEVSGEYTLTVDNMVIRKALTAYELNINKIHSINGGIVVSVANGTVLNVSGTTLYIDEDNGNKQIQFAVDDYIRAQIWTGRGIASYVGRVTAVNHSTTYGSANIVATTISGAPWNGMELVQIGNASVSARQNLIYMTASDTNNPYIEMLSGVNAGSFSGKQKLRIGNLTGITDATYGALSGYGLWGDNVYLTGWIKADTGFIGGWTIDSTSLKKDTGTDSISCGMAPSDYPFYAGKQYSGRATAPFNVTNAGALTAKGIAELGTATAVVGGIASNLAIVGPDIWENAYSGDSSAIHVNRLGYNGGATKYRDFVVYDGKANKVFSITGGATPVLTLGYTSSAVTVNGTLTVTGNIDFSGSSTITLGGNHVVISGTSDITCGAAEGDMTSMSTSFTPKGNKILITFSGSFYVSAANQTMWLIINVAGSNVRSMCSYITSGFQPHALTYIASVTPGSAITVKMRWSGGTNIQQRGTQDGYRVMTITDLH